MKSMGVKNGASNPMPPQQHAYFLSAQETDVNRLVAWAWEHTIAVGHPTAGFDRRSPYCVDKTGKALHIEQAAVYFDWEPANARRVFRRARTQGRLGTDAHRRIWVRGEVIPCIIEADPEAKREGEEKGNKKVCTRYVPDYILLKINERPKEERERILGEETLMADLFDRWKADAIDACRKAYAEDQDKRWEALSLPRRRKIRASKQTKPATPTVKLTLMTNVVQTSDDERSVQRQNPDVVRTSEKSPEIQQNATTSANGAVYGQSVPDALPIVVFGENNRENNNRPDRDPDVVVVADRLGVSDSTAAAFLTECQTKSPGCSLDDIGAVIEQTEATINRKKYPNITGVLLKGVPPKIAAYRKIQEVQKAKAPICGICQKPLDSDRSSINGCHWECFDGRTAKGKTA